MLIILKDSDNILPFNKRQGIRDSGIAGIGTTSGVPTLIPAEEACYQTGLDDSSPVTSHVASFIPAGGTPFKQNRCSVSTLGSSRGSRRRSTDKGKERERRSPSYSDGEPWWLLAQNEGLDLRLELEAQEQPSADSTPCMNLYQEEEEGRNPVIRASIRVISKL